MGLFEIVMKVSHDCPFGNLSRRFPSMRMSVWCNHEHDVIEMIADSEEYRVAYGLLSRIGGIVEESFDGDKIHLVTKKCFCTFENSIGRKIEACNMLYIAPVVYNHGWEYYRIIAFKHEDLKQLLDWFDEKDVEYEILRKAPFEGFIASTFTLNADVLFSGLTAKQMDALVAAYNYGYYNLPRRNDVKTIAGKRRIPRTTFQEHLKKAENKLIRSIMPYMQLFKQSAEEKRENLKVAIDRPPSNQP